MRVFICYKIFRINSQNTKEFFECYLVFCMKTKINFMIGIFDIKLEYQIFKNARLLFG